jgi:hypothetical protein
MQLGQHIVRGGERRRRSSAASTSTTPLLLLPLLQLVREPSCFLVLIKLVEQEERS